MRSETNKDQNAERITLDRLASGVALIRLGQPDERIVTLTMSRVKSLRQALESLKQNPPKGLVITGPHAEMFTAGADLNLIRDVTDAALGEKLAREGQEVFNLLESLPCPTVAAISGPCVGGGCEMVLACKVRLISDNPTSTIGLPEIKLGILPGFGGTQRLPRLIGLPNALDIILAGKTIRPKQALANGLVNEVLSFERLAARAEAIASGQAQATPIRIKLAHRLLTWTKFGRNFVKKKALANVHKETKGFYPAPPAALESVFLGLEQGIHAGLQFEARELGRLIVTPESKSLVNLFFLTELSKGIGKSARKQVEDIHAVVVGAGAMGAGIAGVLARAECHVILKDTTEAAVTRGLEQIKSYIGKIRHLSEQERSFILNRVEITTRDSANISNANFVIEAIFEEMDVKKKVLGDLARLTTPDAIIATNTSSLSVSEMATAIENPSRVVGMHFFNPVEKMPLVEIIRAKETSDRAVAVIAALATKLGKYPIVVKDVPGFLINRVLAPYLNEAAFLLADGYSIRDIDKAATRFGMPMGPIRLLDEIGLDVAVHVQDSMVKGYGERMRGPSFAKTLVDLGRKGKKSGSGFYDFEGKDSTPCPNIRELLKIEAALKTSTDLEPIAERLIMSLINEAIKCLDEGVAGLPGKDAANQIDLGTVMGIGFPPFRGGLLHYAESLGAKAVYATLLKLEKAHGSRFSPAIGAKKRAEKNKKFHDPQG